MVIYCCIGGWVSSTPADTSDTSSISSVSSGLTEREFLNDSGSDIVIGKEAVATTQPSMAIVAPEPLGFGWRAFGAVRDYFFKPMLAAVGVAIGINMGHAAYDWTAPMLFMFMHRRRTAA